MSKVGMEIMEIVPMQDRKYDIIIIGATGVTGTLVTQHLYSRNVPKLSWAIAGRSEKKLATVLESLVDKETPVPDVVVLDIVNDSEAKLKEVLKTTRLVINVVGPYSYWGEHVLKPCIEVGTCWVDLNGEPPWVKHMVAKYQNLAEKTGAVIVPACGFDSIPTDVGLFLLSRFAENPLGTVDAAMEEVVGGYSYGTLSSFLAPYFRYSRKEFLTSKGYIANPYYNCPPSSVDKPPKQPFGVGSKRASASIFRSGKLAHAVAAGEDEKAYYGGSLVSGNPMEAINRTVVMRSIGLRAAVEPQESQRFGDAFKYREWILIPSGIMKKFISAPLSYFIGRLVPFSLTFHLIRSLMKWYFRKTAGEGSKPSQSVIDGGGFRIRIAAEVLDREPKNEKAVFMIEGRRDPGYGWTTTVLAETALYVLSKIRGEGDDVVPAPQLDYQSKTSETFKKLVSEGKEKGDDIAFGKRGGNFRKGGFYTTASLGMGLAERVLRGGYVTSELKWVTDNGKPPTSPTKEDKKTE